MLTLAQARALSQNKLSEYVIDEFRKSALLDMLTFDNTVKAGGIGQSLTYTYNRITTFPQAGSRAINTEFVPQEAVTTPQNANLKVLGGSFQLDRVLIKHETQVVDHIKFQLQQKAQATVAHFHNLFINGDAALVPADFDGIDITVTGGPTEVIPAAPIDLSTSANITANWQVFIDALRDLRARMDGAPTLYLMNSFMYSKWQSVMDRAGIGVTAKSEYGLEVAQWGPSTVMALGDRPGGVNPIIPIVGNVTSIYAVRLGMDGVHGVSPEGDKIVTEYLPDLNAPGAVKTGEVEMVAAIAVKATRCAAVLRNIQVA